MTLTLAAVYAPVAFAPGRTGRLFLEFALTLAGAVLVSGFVALTLTPMMCSQAPQAQSEPGRISSPSKRPNGLERGYRAPLTGVAALMLVFVAGARCWRGSARLFFMAAEVRVAPVEDRGVIQVPARAPEGSTLAFTAAIARGRARSSPRPRGRARL